MAMQKVKYTNTLSFPFFLFLHKSNFQTSRMCATSVYEISHWCQCAYSHHHAWEILWNTLLVKAMNWSIPRKCLLFSHFESVISSVWYGTKLSSSIITKKDRNNSDNYHQNKYEIMVLPCRNDRVAETMTNSHSYCWNTEFKILMPLL